MGLGSRPMPSLNSPFADPRDALKRLTAVRDFWGTRFGGLHGGELVVLWASAVVVLLLAFVVLSRAGAATEYEYVVACHGETRPSTPTLSDCTNRWAGSAAAASFDTLLGWLRASAAGLTLLLLVITWFWVGTRRGMREILILPPEA